MKKLLCLALILLWIAAPFAAAEEAPRALLDLAAAAAGSMGEFEGAPEGEDAWLMMYTALSRDLWPSQGGFLSDEEAHALYRALFAEGELPDLPARGESGVPVDRVEDGYFFDLADGEPPCVAAVNEIAPAEDGSLTADITAFMQFAGGDSEFLFNAYLRCLPDGDSPFGGRLAGLSFEYAMPVFTSATATAQLGGSEITYEAENVLDDDPDTCWSYNEGRDPRSCIALYCEEPQSVRALSLQPQYAKSEQSARANNRVKSLCVTLSDGYTVTADLPDMPSCEAWFTLPFEGVHAVDWVEVQVLEVYPGEEYDDTCVSAIVLN